MMTVTFNMKHIYSYKKNKKQKQLYSLNILKGIFIWTQWEFK